MLQQLLSNGAHWDLALGEHRSGVIRMRENEPLIYASPGSTERSDPLVLLFDELCELVACDEGIGPIVSL
jgi:hypothetical protein